jgi:hypothetical protein
MSEEVDMLQKSCLLLIGLCLISLLLLPGCGDNQTVTEAPSNMDISDYDKSYFALEYQGAAYIEFYEGYNCSETRICTIGLDYQTDSWHFKKHRGWNDEAKSVRLVWIPSGTKMIIADDPDGSKDDDWLEIDVPPKEDSWTGGKKYWITIVIFDLEISYDCNEYRYIYHKDNGLNGKVSYFEYTCE